MNNILLFMIGLFAVISSASAQISQGPSSAAFWDAIPASAAEGAESKDEEKSDSVAQDFKTRMDNMSKRPVGAHIDPATNSLKVG